MAKVMLVEDDNNLREIYEARLQAEGYDIVSARDGEEALVVAKSQKPDLIISDVMMPKISGFEMLDILRNTDGLKDVRVIMLTALGQAEDKSRADALGADKYLVKSQVTLEDIIKTAHQLLDVPAAPASQPVQSPQTSTPLTTPSIPTPASSQTAAPATQSAPVAPPATIPVVPEPALAAPGLASSNQIVNPVSAAATPTSSPTPISAPIVSAPPIAATPPVTAAPTAAEPVTITTPPTVITPPPATATATPPVAPLANIAIAPTPTTAAIAAPPAPTVQPSGSEITPAVSAPPTPSVPPDAPESEPTPLESIASPEPGTPVASAPDVPAIKPVITTASVPDTPPAVPPSGPEPISNPGRATPTYETPPAAVPTEPAATETEPSPSTPETLAAPEIQPPSVNTAETTTAAAKPESTAQEEAAMRAKIQDFISTPSTPPASTAPAEPSAPVASAPEIPTSPATAHDDQVMASAVDSLIAGAASEQKPSDVTAVEVAPPADVVATAQPHEAVTSIAGTSNDNDDSVTVAHKKIIQPITDPSKKKDLNQLLAKEAAGEAIAPPQATAVVNPQPEPVIAAPTTAIPVTEAPAQVDPNSIAL